MDGIMSILLTIVIFVGVVTIIYIVNFNNLQAYKIKINEAESIIDDLLRKKYDNLLLIKDVIVEETDVDAKVFDELKKFKTMNISSFDFENKVGVFSFIRSKLNKILSDKTGKNIGEIEKDTERDYYLNASDALEYGLVDKIL